MNLASEKGVLVVDDEPDVRDFLATCLEDAGFRVRTAFDGADALEKIIKNIPDLITLDLVMPRVSGIELMRKLRTNKEWSKIPVVIITAHAKDEMGKRDVELLSAEEIKPAPEHIIEKPITPTKLVGAVAKILEVKTELDLADERSDVLNLVKTCTPDKLKKIQEVLK